MDGEGAELAPDLHERLGLVPSVQQINQPEQPKQDQYDEEITCLFRAGSIGA